MPAQLVPIGTVAFADGTTATVYWRVRADGSVHRFRHDTPVGHSVTVVVTDGSGENIYHQHTDSGDDDGDNEYEMPPLAVTSNTSFQVQISGV